MESLTSTKECMDKISKRKNRNKDTKWDVKLTFEGVELDINKFAEFIERNWKAMVHLEAKEKADEMFKARINKYMSKHSTNAKLENLKKQFEKINNRIYSVGLNIERLSDEIEKKEL
jgi:predicted  nucleic acid-binding Zn-ribbon protein